MIEKAFVSGNVRSGLVLGELPEEAESCQRAPRGFSAADDVPFRRDGVRGQCEPHSGNARRRRRWPAVGRKPRTLRSNLKEPLNCSFLQRIEKGMPERCISLFNDGSLLLSLSVTTREEQQENEEN